jgi:hypothetical protein
VRVRDDGLRPRPERRRFGQFLADDRVDEGRLPDLFPADEADEVEPVVRRPRGRVLPEHGRVVVDDGRERRPGHLGHFADELFDVVRHPIYSKFRRSSHGQDARVTVAPL